MEVFDCDRYVEILKLMMEENSSVRGYNSRLAEAASCHSSHLSHVLGERGHLTPDQALAIADFWQLPDLQSDYFLTLVEFERAGTERLRKKLRIRLDDIRKEGRRFHGRTAARDEKPRVELSLADATKYCSHWYYCVIHCLIEVKAFRTEEAIAEHLNLSRTLVHHVLENLERMKLLARDENSGEWYVLQGVKYTGPDDLLTLMNSSQRLFASYRRELRNPDDMNVTIVTAIRKSELAAMREMLINCLKDMTKLSAFQENKEAETAMMICLDLFEI